MLVVDPVGRDLQFIRINGTMVGGLVGMHGLAGVLRGELWTRQPSAM